MKNFENHQKAKSLQKTTDQQVITWRTTHNPVQIKSFDDCFGHRQRAHLRTADPVVQFGSLQMLSIA